MLASQDANQPGLYSYSRCILYIWYLGFFILIVFRLIFIYIYILFDPIKNFIFHSSCYPARSETSHFGVYIVPPLLSRGDYGYEADMDAGDKHDIRGGAEVSRLVERETHGRQWAIDCPRNSDLCIPSVVKCPSRLSRATVPPFPQPVYLPLRKPYPLSSLIRASFEQPWNHSIQRIQCRGNSRLSAMGFQTVRS